jgi:predicted ester cyclase
MHFHAEIHRQLADGECVTTDKTYHGTHEGALFGIAPTHRKIQFESVDVRHVRNGKITDHWDVGNLVPRAAGTKMLVKLRWPMEDDHW